MIYILLTAAMFVYFTCLAMLKHHLDRKLAISNELIKALARRIYRDALRDEIALAFPQLAVVLEESGSRMLQSVRQLPTMLIRKGSIEVTISVYDYGDYRLDWWDDRDKDGSEHRMWAGPEQFAFVSALINRLSDVFAEPIASKPQEFTRVG